MENHIDSPSVWACSPGETLCDILKSKNITLEVFADLIEESQELVGKILLGEVPVSSEMAVKISKATSTSASFWIRREARFRERLVEIARVDSEQSSVEWLRALPLRELNDLGWLGDSSVVQPKVQDCLDFFAVQSISEWEERYGKLLSAVAFKKSNAYESSFGSMASWMRKVEIETESQECGSWDSDGFRNELSGIRALTRKKDPSDFLPDLRDRCNRYGVRLVILKTPKGCPVSGMSRFESSKAVIALSFRYLSDDHFWFAFFHEAAHLLLHEEAILRLEGLMNKVFDKEEEEANLFAAEILIPPEFEKELMTLALNHKAIMAFARKIGVSPGIVVGQLQFRKRLSHSQQNSLKRRFSWA